MLTKFAHNTINNLAVIAQVKIMLEVSTFQAF